MGGVAFVCVCVIIVGDFTEQHVSKKSGQGCSSGGGAFFSSSSPEFSKGKTTQKINTRTLYPNCQRKKMKKEESVPNLRSKIPSPFVIIDPKSQKVYLLKDEFGVEMV